MTPDDLQSTLASMLDAAKQRWPEMGRYWDMSRVGEGLGRYTDGTLKPQHSVVIDIKGADYAQEDGR